MIGQTASQLRKDREKAFHNQSFREGTRVQAHKYYLVAKSDTRFYENYLREKSRNKSVLEYGCGVGSLFDFLLPNNVKTLTGIDISDVAIQKAKQRYQKQVTEGKVCFCVMDAEKLHFKENIFDIVCGKSILHHLDLERCFLELSRVLKPDGSAIFLEPLGHNPIINLYRKLTPRLRTVDEHPLRTSDLELSKMYFENVEFHFFRLTSILALPFRSLRIFDVLVDKLDNFDQFLFKYVPFLRKHAWIVIMILSRPKELKI